jgi:hypothetical protein
VITDRSWYLSVTSQLVKNFEYPLHSVQSCCEMVLKKILIYSTQSQVEDFLQSVEQMKSRHEIKSRYLALTLALEYIDIKKYLAQNPNAIREMIQFATETQTVGKYVLNYFADFLKKLWSAVGGRADAWYKYWIDDYLQALRSNDELLRTAVCTQLTPIVTKINKMSLAVILSEFLNEYKGLTQQSVSTLEPLLTLLKIARVNKMICISDLNKDVRLERSVQEALTELQGEDTPVFSVL